jgi:hypothetical protein
VCDVREWCSPGQAGGIAFTHLMIDQPAPRQGATHPVMHRGRGKLQPLRPHRFADVLIVGDGLHGLTNGRRDAFADDAIEDRCYQLTGVLVILQSREDGPFRTLLPLTLIQQGDGLNARE